MKASLLAKLESLCERHEEVSALLGDPDTIADQTRYRDLSKEFSQLDELVKQYSAYREAVEEKAAAQDMLDDADPDVRAMATEEIEVVEAAIINTTTALELLLLPKDPRDEQNVFLEIRAGTGGDEAAIFSGDLLKMYLRFAETRGWRSEVISERPGDHGGFKEVIARLIGDDVYAHLKFESGAHRVQRIPETESQGRIHTSACTVAVLAEPPEVEVADINKSDLRIDTFRSSGAGGQHVNTTDSAVRITHLPTGLVVECQDERSQHKNKARAMSLLQARLASATEAQATAEQAAERRNLVGTGDRSDRIRTYNYPQGRVTDHRINLTLYKLDEILTGDLDVIIQPLRREHQADQLAAMSEQ